MNLITSKSIDIKIPIARNVRKQFGVCRRRRVSATQNLGFPAHVTKPGPAEHLAKVARDMRNGGRS